MMTLCAQLCVLCAVCALMQMAVPQDWQGDSLRLIGGMLMLHLVVSGAHEIISRIIGQQDLMRTFEILIE